mmetsp:Transcript_273/g.455  ORF Transcript_273/g.455 Transcript_273/m.455 type:complete len:204 (-) Transcript_273:1600-2211(-)
MRLLQRTRVIPPVARHSHHVARGPVLEEADHFPLPIRLHAAVHLDVGLQLVPQVCVPLLGGYLLQRLVIDRATDKVHAPLRPLVARLQQIVQLVQVVVVLDTPIDLLPHGHAVGIRRDAVGAVFDQPHRLGNRDARVDTVARDHNGVDVCSLQFLDHVEAFRAEFVSEQSHGLVFEARVSQHVVHGNTLDIPPIHPPLRLAQS